MCFALINHSHSTVVVSFNFFETTHESDQGALMVPVVRWQRGPEPPHARKENTFSWAIDPAVPTVSVRARARVCVFVSRNAIIEVDRRAGHWGTCLQMLCHTTTSPALPLHSHLSFSNFAH